MSPIHPPTLMAFDSRRNKSPTTNKLIRLQATTTPIITPPATSTRASEIDPSPSKVCSDPSYCPSFNS
ncbi:hypothetical protein LINPERHAP2_LOCUS19251 [Linum perenne]